MHICEMFEEASELAMTRDSRFERAKALGFDTTMVYYHGTGKNFLRFSAKFHGSTMGAQNREPFAVWLTSSPEVAGVYAAYDPSEHTWWGKEEDMPKPGIRNPNLLPILIRVRNPSIIDCSKMNHYQLLRQKGRLIHIAKEDGNDAIIFRSAEDGSDDRSDIVGVFNPRNVRSVYAKFDPARQGTTDLMA